MSAVVASQQGAPIFYVTSVAPPVSPAASVEEPPVPVGRDPVIMTCPHCRCRNKTRIVLRATAKTHIACCLLSWTLCLCRLPYRMKSCLNTDHFCVTCDAFLGTYAA